MNGRERLLSLLDGGRPDCLPQMPITMMFAADHAGVPYQQYATNHRALVEAQIRTAEDFEFIQSGNALLPLRRGAIPFLRRKFGLVFQDYALFPHLNVRDNVAYGLMVKGMGRAQRHAKADILAAHICICKDLNH